MTDPCTFHDVIQGSDEWLAARLGIPTASNFGAVLAKGEGKSRAAYMRKIAAEIITGEPGESFKSLEMARGNEMEASARREYGFMHDVDPKLVGFATSGRAGASPDALIGDDGLLEIKTQRGDLMIETILRGGFPPEHVAQCQGALMVTGREWIDLCVFWPKMPLFVRRAHRDEAYIANLCVEIARFNAEIDELVHKIRSYRQ